MAEEYDVFDDLLIGIEDENEELSVQQASGSKTWAVDWVAGRFSRKVDDNLAVVHRTAKYMVTPRGEVEVYSRLSEMTDGQEDFYGSFLHKMISEVYPTLEDIENEIQAMCELAVTELPDISSIEVGNLKQEDDTVSFSFYITPLNGATEEVNMNAIRI